MIESKARKVYQVVINTVLVIISLVMILPIVLLFMSSITSEKTLLVYGYSFFPREFSLNAYNYIFKNASSIFSAYGITFLVTIVGTVISLAMTIMLAYPLSLKKLPGRKVISFYILFTMLFNGGLVPTYIMYTTFFGIKNTLFAYIVPGFLLSAMNVILMRTYFMNSIPESLYESAEIDGASGMVILWKLVIPLGKPIIVTIALFVGLGYWNDWTNGLYYINKANLYSMQVLLNRMIQDIQALMANSSSASSGALSASTIPAVSVRMAIAFVALLPILVLYPLLQKYFASGIMLGAVKG